MQYLILGDSHMVGEMGQTLARELTAKGHATLTLAKTGTGVSDWLGHNFGAYQEHTPLVHLATNDYNERSDQLTADAIKLMRKFKLNGWWFGMPPETRADVAAERKRVNAALKAATKATGWDFYANDGQERPIGDGLHFAGAPAQALGHRLAAQVLSMAGMGRVLTWTMWLAAGVAVGAGARWAWRRYRGERRGLGELGDSPEIEQAFTEFVCDEDEWLHDGSTEEACGLAKQNRHIAAALTMCGHGALAEKFGG